MEKQLIASMLMVSLGLLTACGSGSSSPTDNDDFFVPNDLGAVSQNPFDTERLKIVQISMPDADDPALDAKARELRAAGEVVINCLSSNPDPRCDREIVEQDGDWIVQPLTN